MSNYLPIAALEQRDGLTGSSLVKGLITLIWPYSQSSKNAAILLAEPDFRLRHKKGQVRIQFGGSSALALSKSQIEIGDEVILALQGVRWVESEAGVVSTPGKSVGLEIRFSNVLDMKIFRNGRQHAHIRVDNPPTSTPSHSQPQTPALISTPYTPAEQILETFETPLSVSAPTFHQSARKTSGNLVDSPYDPFADEEFGLRRPKRPRISWGSQKRYRMTDQIPSPQKEESELSLLADGIEFADVEEDESAAQILRESFFTTTAPPRDFGDLLPIDSSLPASQESPVQSLSGSFTVFKDPPPLFSRTTTTSTVAPRFSFSSHDMFATQQTQPTASSQDDIFKSNELTTSQLASQHLQYQLQSPEKLMGAESLPQGTAAIQQASTDHERHEEAKNESSNPPHDDLVDSDNSPHFVAESPEFFTPRHLPHTPSRSRRYSLDRDTSVPEFPSTSQEVLQPISTGFSPQTDQGLNVFDPALSFESPTLGLDEGVMSSPTSAQAGPRLSDADIEAIISQPNVPAHLQISNDPGMVVDIPGFIPYADEDWTQFNYDVPYYPDIPSQQATQESEYHQGITYPQIHGLDDQRVIPETQETEVKEDRQEELPTSQSEIQAATEEPSPTKPRLESDAHENAQQVSVSTPARRANAILSTIRDQLSPQGTFAETVELVTSLEGRKSPTEPETALDSSPLASLLQRAATKSPATGLRTRISYYSHLSNLVSTLNRFSQYDSTVDVLAIVVRDSSRPLRAEKGQKDYFTRFRITQPGHWPMTTLVNVFRPFKAALPTAKKGEVILLRDFEGMSLKGGLVGLISSERSGWCVFKRLNERDENGYRVREKSVGAEETKGPPVEFGEEERNEAERLIEWWDNMGK